MATYRITLTATFRGSIMENVLHFWRIDQSFSMTTIMETIRDQWLPEFKKFSVDQVVWTNIRAQLVEPGPGLAVNLAVNVAGTSNATDPRDHPCICEKIRLQSNTPGKTGRGRIFCPVASSFGGNVGVLTVATLNARNAVLATLMQRFCGGEPSTGLNLVIAPRNNPVANKEVVNMFCDSTYGIQRRRNVGVGI